MLIHIKKHIIVIIKIIHSFKQFTLILIIILKVKTKHLGDQIVKGIKTCID